MTEKHLKTFFTLLFTNFLFVSIYAQGLGLPPELDATLNDTIYCVGTEKSIVENFTLTDPDNSAIDGVFIQISSGYISSEDILSYKGPNTDIIPFWDSGSGKLQLLLPSHTTDYQIFIDAVQNVVYTNSNLLNPTGTREFSITLDEANYLPSTGHYYQYIQAEDITWENAKIAAENPNSKYYGLQGYLATITSLDEAKLAGEQADGNGWIGGSDKGDDFTWKWVTGPEAGKSFWFGLSNGNNNGADFTYENWKNGEPNNWQNNVTGVPHAEDYLHIYRSGKWNDFPNNSNDISGYIVEYGGMPGDPVLNNSASTKIIVGEITSPPTSSPICGSGSATISAISNTGKVNWYNAPTGGTSIWTGDTFTTPNISSTTSYYAAPGDCSGVRKEVIAIVNPLPTIQDTVILKNCDKDGTPDGLIDFNLTEADELITFGDSNLSVTYYLSQIDAETASNPLTPFPFNNSTSNLVFSRVENSFGCYRIGTLSLDVSTTQFPPGYIYDLVSCENDDSNDGISSFNLTLASTELLNQLPSGQNLSVHYYRDITDAQLELNEITPQDAYLNETPWNETLIIRVENDDNGDCYDIGPFVTLTVNERPEFQVLLEGTVCINTPPLEMEILEANGSYNYEWKDPLGTVISNSEFAEAYIGGTYTVQAFSTDGCESFIQNITVLESEIAQISIDDISIVDDSENNSISINESNLGSGDYEYTLDDPNGFYQDEPYFDGVTAGIHTIYVRDKNGCGVAGVEVSVIGFPKFFTPNNDGYNDTWQVKGVSGDFYPSSLIYIFDRYGKLLVQIDPRNEGWDGFYNGIMLPASDYWYSVQLIDSNNNTKERKGHFSLIRR